MPIELRCSCGRRLRVRDELADKTVRCPHCQASLQVPLPVEAIEDVEPAEVVEGAVAAGPPPLPAAGEEYVEVELIEDGVSAGAPPRRASKPRPKYDDPPPPPAPPRSVEKKKKKKKESVYSQFYGKSRNEGDAFEEAWLGTPTSDIVGGAFFIFLALIIMLLMLAFGASLFRAMLWSVVIFVLGVLAILKGVMELYQK
jgi:hypothetical protein